MPHPLVSAALALLLAAQPRAAEDPRAIVRQATRAVEGDSVASVRARWAARLRQDSADRAAVLGVATLGLLPFGESAARLG